MAEYFNQQRPRYLTSKLVEYDIQIEALQQVEHPWVKKAIEVSGERYWLEVVFEKVAIGELPVYRSYLAPNIYARIQLSEINQNFEGTLEDAFWVIDPITFEERAQFEPREPWRLEDVISWRTVELWEWNESARKMEGKTLGLALPY